MDFANRSEEGVEHAYIKYYRGQPLLIIVDVPDRGRPLRVRTAFNVQGDFNQQLGAKRKGVLLFRKTPSE